MLSLRVYHRANPQWLLEERSLSSGELVIGRGRDADWRLDDPARELSRRHCVVAVGAEGGVTLFDLSANGVLVGPNAQRIAARARWRLDLPAAIALGPYLVEIVDTAARPEVAPGSLASELARWSAEPATPPASWDTGAHPVLKDLPQGGQPDAMLAAFCAGAQLEPSVFAGEDPAELMRRLGAVYQQMVLGLSNVMGERIAEKAAYRMERTSIRAIGANPLRWQGARRAAVDLLRADLQGFLPGPAAVAAAFLDAERHMACSFAGSNNAIEAVFTALDPATAKTAADYRKTYERYRREARDNPEGLVNRAFREGYANHIAAFDRDDEAA
ncbi:MAG TPA: type VI secretion system-associated FHA domain protein [Caulobacteraceae bacterium]|nr:type VI secretion system-associated FHA domain protein [Caulobacteraceae bacterium]